MTPALHVVAPTAGTAALKAEMAAEAAAISAEAAEVASSAGVVAPALGVLGAVKLGATLAARVVGVAGCILGGCAMTIYAARRLGIIHTKPWL